ncbi:3-isopropylmalate dehydratase small subunit [Xenorhabdus sp. PB61.4]|uniref:3-isopropylmalate dehydratase small subunit n=1 Tax=Xenorhabdus sp. PB61.4 TaxID=2788940 RepID=UPI001E38946D|nr:3-isopropylmalate dehydratase small subunit [Xenorhabdus sp. PB61.4]MCC8368344.1 3-isopropylmalate dehydratase small subunit [Xenorhabdus sp. PB61.4]
MIRNIYRGRGMPLVKNNIDTDQIMPARFCYRHTRRGHDNSVFGDWREDANFIMNNPNYQRATILVTGREFATGSSREYAVWGLKDWGFKVIIAPSFGDIFYKNASINDLLPIILNESDIEIIWEMLFDDYYMEISIDLHHEIVIAKDIEFKLTIDPIVKKRYIEDLDDIKDTLTYLHTIEKFEINNEK